ncbi:ABC transporter permease [Falsiroseomonas sp. HW251]|uniref:ABC transporter permease n=1 Tax=Falsiroseomonas sp. HW251 TaxID=3390998 RepID=UPI003D316015
MHFLRHNPLAALGALILLAVLLAVTIGPVFTVSPIAIDMQAALRPPSLAHPFGTDFFGRDVLARVLHGGQATLTIGIGVVALAFLAGTTFGLIAGFAGGWPDLVMMRVVDALLSFPSLVLAIALAAALGPSLTNAMLAVAVALAPQFARLARAQALSISVLPYVEAAVAAGSTPGAIIRRHVLPNGIGPLLVQASLAVGSAILQTAGLGFLGLGAQPPAPEWGADVAANLQYLRETPWPALAPGLAILATVIGFNLIGDALGDWFDPRRRSE